MVKRVNLPITLFKYNLERVIYFLFPITKEESIKIRKKYPKAEIRRTVKQKSKRHKYFCPEIKKYLVLIKGTNEVACSIYTRKRKYFNA